MLKSFLQCLVSLGSAALLTGLVFGSLVLPRTEAGFSATTESVGNSVAADTLDPPTALVATGGVTITLATGSG